MEKALLFSDSHGSNEDMINVIKQYAGQVSAVFHMGDIQGAEGLLQNAASEIGCLAYIVRGNCDRNPDLKEANVIGFAGKRIALCHGHRFGGYGDPDMDSLRYFGEENNADVVLFGHTHKPFCEKFGEVLICNPGSISQPRGGSKKGYAVLVVDEDEVSVEFFEV